MLCALAVALSVLEGLLPTLPVPGAKWGLSNLATMTALSVFGLPQALAVTVVKAGFAFFRGGISGAMSLCGGLLSTLVMAALLRGKSERLSLVGVGVLGAVAHNAGQLMAAMALLSPALMYYAPWLLITALVAGALTGVAVRVVYPHLRRLPLW
jgi:heptaprenyl diphosphate synthase